VPHFLKATELDPEFDQAYLYLGRSYLSLGRWGDAVQPLRTAYRLAPAETQKEIGSILFDALLSTAVGDLKKGEFLPAIEHLREGLALNPSSPQAKNELAGAFVGYGGALLRDGRVTDAISAFQQALGVAPGSLDAYLGLAKAFMSQGEPVKAKEAADSAIRIAPGKSRTLNDMLERIGTPR
ncbi:MAG: tetratricopeptide repeat protein, partial [Desulfobulbaceae bacterium]|nr:tetratricopeptide repeat protein [Desulfobulbaceae bacterium]